MLNIDLCTDSNISSTSWLSSKASFEMSFAKKIKFLNIDFSITIFIYLATWAVVGTSSTNPLI